MEKLYSVSVAISQVIVITVLGLVYCLALASTTYAAGNTIYVSTSGNDSNPGTSAAPVKTFVKAQTLAGAGDKILVQPGTYTENLKITKSGSNGSPLVVKANGAVVIDGQNSRGNLIEVPASTQYVTIEGFEAKNSNGFGGLISGQHITLDGLNIHDIRDMGLMIEGQHMMVKNSTISRATTENQARNASSGWGSGFKCKVGGDDITFQNNTAFHNYGEGFAITRCSNVRVIGNSSYDNYAVNIYIDNSYDVVVEKNFVTCSGNSGFEYLDGKRMSGIALAEEQYDGWGAKLARVVVKNNIVSSCNRGVIYFGADISGGGLDTVTIANNTLWNIQDSAISIARETAKARSSQIVNNIAHNPQGKVAWIEDTTGLTLSNNFWVRSTAPSSDTKANGPGDKFASDVRFATTPGSAATSFRLASDSPAIDGGKVISQVSDDYEGKNRAGQFDMGAIEFGGSVVSSPSPTPSPSPSPTPSVSPSLAPAVSPTPGVTPSPGNTCRNSRQDVNRDGIVNLLDYAAVVEGMRGNGANNPNLDVIVDGKVNLLDLADVIANLMRSCPVLVID